jgi:hypothetical protein
MWGWTEAWALCRHCWWREKVLESEEEMWESFCSLCLCWGDYPECPSLQAAVSASPSWNTVDPWYLKVCCSKKISTEENPHMLRMHRVQHSRITQIYLHCVGMNTHNLKQYGLGYISTTRSLLYTLTLLTKNWILLHALSLILLMLDLFFT